MSEIRRRPVDAPEVEALITDRYLDSLLSLAHADLREGEQLRDAEASVAAAVRAVSRKLATDLPRFHPSFRFEERLALRLAELAAAMRMPIAAGKGPEVIQRIPLAIIEPLRPPGDATAERDARPLLIGGAVAASALSLAGAWLAWRHRTTPMSRASRAAHVLRQPLWHG